MRVRFKGEMGADGEMLSKPCTVFGQAFPVGQWVDVEGRAAQKLPGNPMFEAEESEPEDQSGPTIEELRAELDAREVKYHPRAGVQKLQALLAAHERGEDVEEGAEGGE
jgi:hypothetical protein